MSMVATRAQAGLKACLYELEPGLQQYGGAGL
jgi:hypothetical protein